MDWGWEGVGMGMGGLMSSEEEWDGEGEETEAEEEERRAAAAAERDAAEHATQARLLLGGERMGDRTRSWSHADFANQWITPPTSNTAKPPITSVVTGSTSYVLGPCTDTTSSSSSSGSALPSPPLVFDGPSSLSSCLAPFPLDVLDNLIFSIGSIDYFPLCRFTVFRLSHARVNM